MRSHITDCGIPGIAEIPYGFHMCHFYQSSRVLLDGLTPYFLAGVRKNERCLWVASAPLPVEDIRAEIRTHPDLASAVKTGQLRVLDAGEWYGEPSALDADAIVQRLIEEEERAVLDGYAGLRIACNTSFVPRDHWDRLIEFEERLHDNLYGRRILVSCSYQRDDCRPTDVMEVAHRHHAVLDKGERYWEVLMPQPARR